MQTLVMFFCVNTANANEVYDCEADRALLSGAAGSKSELERQLREAREENDNNLVRDLEQYLKTLIQEENAVQLRMAAHKCGKAPPLE